MARRGRDLFEILGAQASSRAAARRDRRSDDGERTGVLEPLRNLLGGGDQSRGTPRGRVGGRGGAKPLPRVSGIAVAAIAFVCLGLGFVLGRATAVEARAAGTRDLRQDAAASAPSPGGESPGWLGDRGIDLSAEREEQKLSKFGYRLLFYPARLRDQAAVVARWLRGQGLSKARIRRQARKRDGAEFYAVVCYADAADDGTYELLRSLGPSPVEPRLRAAIEGLPPEPHEFDS